MNYRHSYHAGNFADVFKHIVVVGLLQALQHKETAFCFLDTHAGAGSYDLTAPAAHKSKEYQQGISKIMTAENPPTLVKDYLQIITAMNTENALRYYPGSPAIAKTLLRPQDRMVLTELHIEEWQSLKNLFYQDKQVSVHHQDGYQALKAFLPPPERRGLVLIDPPYEQNNEFTLVTDALATAVKRWETGIYALWYPIKETRSIARWHHSLQLKINRPLLAVELCIHANLPTHLNGSGLVIVNPPWQFADEIKALLPWLWRVLSPNKMGYYEIKNLFIQ